MYEISSRTVRTATTRVLIATAATATVCAYCSTPPTLPIVTTAAIVDTAAIVQSPTTVGIADSDLYGMSQADIDKTLDTLESIGVQDVRVFVPWAYVEPAQGTYDWSYLDNVINAAAARNMGVLAVVNATPSWDASSSALPGAGTPTPAAYASFLTQVAKRYGTDISSYEVWNEPNYAASFDPIDPAAYTALLKAAYPAIKAVDPSATVVAGALGSTISLGNLTLDPVTFVKTMLADGAAGYFDALSFHPYQETTEFSQGASVANSPINQLDAIEQLLVANGLSSDKVWLTEYGLSTADVSQQTQATYIQDLIDSWQKVSYAGPVFLYTAQDAPSTDPTDTFGIYGSDWTPKLAAAVIQQEIARLAAPATPPATDPLTALGQQLGQQLANSLAAAAQAFNQQLANALAQALANAFAAFAANASAATPATQAVATPATQVAAAPAQVKTLAVTPKATPASTTPTATTPATTPTPTPTPTGTTAPATTTTPATTKATTKATTAPVATGAPTVTATPTATNTPDVGPTPGKPATAAATATTAATAPAPAPADHPTTPHTPSAQAGPAHHGDPHDSPQSGDPGDGPAAGGGHGPTSAGGHGHHEHPATPAA